MAELGEGTHDTTVESRTLLRDDCEVPIIHARTDGMPKAGVVLHPDIMGIRPLFEDMARRLASHGFAVAVVEPFARISADERAAGQDAAVRMQWVAGLDDDDQLADLEAAANLLVVEDGVARVGVLGFCMGGMYTLKAAATERFDAAVAFYGMIRVPQGWGSAHLREPLATAADVCPTLAIFGSADTFTPAADIEALRAAWAGRDDCEIVVIEGAEHGFVHAPDRPAHRPDDAQRLWSRAVDWLS
ncbi:MAG TPA: dienelactone hydrolase family protein [Acidimicrobiia bacterium]|jgi:carboxymethylenebutenolidase